MRINHNIPAINANNQLKQNMFSTSKSLEKLSSGLRINRAADDSAGLTISEKMKSQIRGLSQADRNILDGVSLVQTAEGGLGQIQNPNLQRLRELAIQSTNDTLTDEDRQEIQKEVQQIKKGINEIANNTTYNNLQLLNVPDEGVTETIESVGSTEKIITVNPNERVIAGYIKVPDPPDPDTMRVKAFFGTISGAVWPDLNIKSPNGEWFGYGTPKMDGETYQEDANNTSSSKASYTGWGSSDEEMIFENPISGKWFIEIRHDGGLEPSTFKLESNYLIYDGTTETTIVENETPGILNLQVGANSDETFSIDLTDATMEALGLGDLDLSTRENAELAISDIDKAIETVSSERSKFGAYQNGLEYLHSNVSNANLNLTSAQARIADADMALQMTEFTKKNILNQSAQAMLAQANQLPQGLLQLLK